MYWHIPFKYWPCQKQSSTAIILGDLFDACKTVADIKEGGLSGPHTGSYQSEEDGESEQRCRQQYQKGPDSVAKEDVKHGLKDLENRCGRLFQSSGYHYGGNNPASHHQKTGRTYVNLINMFASLFYHVSKKRFQGTGRANKTTKPRVMTFFPRKKS